MNRKCSKQWQKVTFVTFFESARKLHFWVVLFGNKTILFSFSFGIDTKTKHGFISGFKPIQCQDLKQTSNLCYSRKQRNLCSTENWHVQLSFGTRQRDIERVAFFPFAHNAIPAKKNQTNLHQFYSGIQFLVSKWTQSNLGLFWWNLRFVFLSFWQQKNRYIMGFLFLGRRYGPQSLNVLTSCFYPGLTWVKFLFAFSRVCKKDLSATVFHGTHTQRALWRIVCCAGGIYNGHSYSVNGYALWGISGVPLWMDG